jgi:hypothetical protein
VFEFFSAHLTWFAVAYQVPSVVVGLILTALLPHPLLRALFFLPGTMVHELLHWVVGGMTNAKPVSFSLLPRKVSGGQWVLGSVGFTNIRWYNAALVGLAPLLAPLIALFFVPAYGHWSVSKVDFAYWAITGPIFAMCLPSWVDVELATRSWFPVSIIAGLLIWNCCFR